MDSRQPAADGFHNMDGYAVPRLFVNLGIRLQRNDPVNPVICPSLQTQALPGRQAADSFAVPDPRRLPPAFSNPAVLFGHDTSGVACEFRFLVHIHTAEVVL